MTQALNCTPMNDDDRAIVRVAIRGMYGAVGLPPPPDERILFVSSPFVAEVAGGFAAALWHIRTCGGGLTKTDAIEAVKSALRCMTDLDARLSDAILETTLAATEWDGAAGSTQWNAAVAEFELICPDVISLPLDSISSALDRIKSVISDQTLDIDELSAGLIARNPTVVANFLAINRVIQPAQMSPDLKKASAEYWLLSCAYQSLWMYDRWLEAVFFVDLLTFLRDDVRVDESHGIDFSTITHYEEASLHSGGRTMHEHFCIISDRPSDIRTVTIDGLPQLHNSSGPAKWFRDGWSIYAIDGVVVPAQVVEAPTTLTADLIASERNVEVRRIMLDRFGVARFIREIGNVMIEDDPLHGKLYRYEQPDDEAISLLEIVNASPEPIGYTPEHNDVVRDGRVWKTYFLRVPPTCATAREARAWTFGLRPDEFAPIAES